MKVSILGAGYVGAVSAACLSKLGNAIVVADVNSDKVSRIGRGESPIIEAGLDEMLKAGVDAGLLTATTDVAGAVRSTDASIVCVGTPSRPDGSLDLQYIRAVCETLGEEIKTKDTRHTVIIRSTMVPGTMAKVVIPTIEKAAGKEAFKDFGVAIYPEFLREGTAIKDFFEAAITLYGVNDDATASVLREINSGIESDEVVTSLEAAEAVKYANNCWHAVKVTFANEIGNISRAAGVDGAEVMRIVCLDDRLNISPAYMRPGFAFGGSCLPKDLRAIRSLAAEMDVPTPLFDATLEANGFQVAKAVDLLEETGAKRTVQIGLTFKDDTDDLRESPLITLGNLLIERGADVRFYDANVLEALKKEEFKNYFESSFPEIAKRFVSDVNAAYVDVDSIIYGRSDPEVAGIVDDALENKKVVDLVRIGPHLRSNESYAGICW